MARQASMTEQVFYHEQVFGVKVASLDSFRVRTRTIAALIYAGLAIVFAFTYELFDEDESRLADVYFAGALLVHPIVGILVPRWWALLLPFAGLVVVLPFSEADPEFFGITDAGVMFLGGFFAMILIAFGIGCRLTADMLREPR
jgi:hypothetical protein